MLWDRPFERLAGLFLFSSLILVVIALVDVGLNGEGAAALPAFIADMTFAICGFVASGAAALLHLCRAADRRDAEARIGSRG